MMDPETRAALKRISSTLGLLSAEVGELHKGVMNMLLMQTQTLQTLAKAVPPEQFPPQLLEFYRAAEALDKIDPMNPMQDIAKG